MPRVDETAVRSVLADFKDPETGRSVLQMEQVRDLQVADNRLSLTLALTTHSAPLWKEAQEALRNLLRQRLPDLTEVRVDLVVHQRPPARQGEFGIAAKSIIAVGSGKGGVGKSTIAASVALRPRPRRGEGRSHGCRRLRAKHSASARSPRNAPTRR